MFVHRAIKKILKILALTLFCPWVIFPQDSQAQELGSFKSEIPFGVRMCFFRGSVDSTKCLVTISVDNENLLFYRGEGYYEAHYEVFLSMRDSKSRYQVRGDWDKKARVPSYDETTLAAHYDPLQEEIYVPSGKYEGFVEVKDMQANTYGNGRVSVVVPDFFTNLPKMSTPLFYDPGELEADTMPALPKPDEFLRSASLKYPAGKPIFMLIDIYADSTAPMEDWSLTAEIVKELMVFPRVEVPIAEGIYAQRRLLKISTQTMSLGSYQIEIKLKDKANNVLARTTS
ncbi:MAG TPA: hypothetical protein VM123_04210, partial [archaeon]|nr:hypothetical protein [archaeon]